MEDYRRSPRGGVDRNLSAAGLALWLANVAPLAGAWIETILIFGNPQQ